MIELPFIVSPAAILLLIAVFLSGGIGALLLGRFFDSRLAGLWAHGVAFIGSLLGLLIAGSVLFYGQGIAFAIPSVFPGLSFEFRVDGLSAFFLAVISLVAAVASLYGISYQKHFYGKYDLGTFGLFYNAFVGSLMLVTMANHALFFLFVWEIMSLASYFLVVFEHREAENVKAGFLYFLMTHFGTAFITLAFFLAYKATGEWSFDAWRAAAGTLAPALQTGIFAAALIGFGTKAGIIPLHIWLPEAHPAAPSHVSALMSGVMIKTAIFMFIRVFFDFFPVAGTEWGLIFLVLGGISALLGVLYALSEHDLKRLLAYHSVENIGIILLGFGAGLVFFSLHLETFALFALAAALYHTMNHAIFKALLFLGAGSVVSATGTRNMEEYGGLAKLLPATSMLFLIGSLAISAFPPFNGFASEWLTFQALFAGIASASVIIKSVFIFAIGSLAFTGGLAAACFVKAFGSTFLARPRSEHARHAHESGWPMIVAMAVLALLTLVLGVFSTAVIAALVGVVASIGLTQPLTLQFPFMRFFEARDEFAVLPLEGFAIALLAVFALVAVIVIVLTRSRKVVISRTWDCGTPLAPRMEITAGSFSRSLVTIFRGILRSTKQTDTEYHDENMRYFIKSQEVKTEIGDPYREKFYGPINALLTSVASRARRIQGGSVNIYLLYIFVTLVALLVWASR
jgi:hydrogenase-4 component B